MKLLHISDLHVGRSLYKYNLGQCQREIFDEIRELKQFPNIIIKYGRFIPGHSPIYDEVLGVNLASKNQFAVKIS